jgi:hypothetical protein
MIYVIFTCNDERSNKVDIRNNLIKRLIKVIIIIIIIIIIKSSVDRDNNYCHYVILQRSRLRNYATLSSGWIGGYLWY